MLKLQYYIRNLNLNRSRNIRNYNSDSSLYCAFFCQFLIEVFLHRTKDIFSRVDNDLNKYYKYIWSSINYSLTEAKKKRMVNNYIVIMISFQHQIFLFWQLSRRNSGNFLLEFIKELF